jgi:predicted secreted protein
MADSDKNIRITTNKNKPSPAKPQIVFTGASAGSSVITLEVLDDNTISFTSNEGQIFSLDNNLTSGTIWSVNDVSGMPILRASAG